MANQYQEKKEHTTTAKILDAEKKEPTTKAKILDEEKKEPTTKAKIVDDEKKESTTKAKTLDEEKKEPTTKAKILAMGTASLLAIAKLTDRMLPNILHAYCVGNEYYVKYKALWLSNVPADVNNIILGCFLCLYGGNYPALIATVTAIQQSGQWHVLKKGLIAIYEQVKEASQVLQEDEMVKMLDKNKDGHVSLEEIAAALQEQGKGLIITVMPSVLQKIDPNVMNDAITSVWAIWCSVMITLHSVFARQIAMGMQVGEIISQTAKQHISPVVAARMDKNYKIWADYGVLIACKFCGVMVAMFLTKLIGGFMTAMQGGEIVAKAVIIRGKQYKFIVSEDTGDLQSIIMYIIGGLGFYYQVTSGFSMNVILRTLLMPASVAEMILGFFVYRG